MNITLDQYLRLGRRDRLVLQIEANDLIERINEQIEEAGKPRHIKNMGV